MLTGRIAFVSLFLVLNVSAAHAQSAAPSRLAQNELDSRPGQPTASFPRLAAFPVAARPWSAEPALLRDTKAFRQSSRRAGGTGAIIGSAVGSMLGAAFAYAGCDRGMSSCSGSFYLGAVAGALPGAGIGALVGHQFARAPLAYKDGGKSVSGQ